MPEAAVSRGLRHPLTVPCLLLLLTLLAYANSFPGAFILDDHHIARNNPLFDHPDLWLIFRADYWYGIENSGLFRPLTILSLLANRLLLGPVAWGFHLVNVLLHAGVAILLWLLLRRWGVAARAAALGAALFAVHPVHTEVVNMAVGRSELLVALFLLVALLLADREGWRWWAAAGLCYLLALLSKEHAITFLVLLPLRDAFAGSAGWWRRRWPLYAMLLGIAVAWLLWRSYALINPYPAFAYAEAANPLAHVGSLPRVLTALCMQGLYLAKLVYPFALQAVYAPPDLPALVAAPASLRGFLVIAAVAALAALLAAGWRRGVPLALLAALYLVAFAPTSNLLLPVGVAMAERLVYFPSLWFCAAAGMVLAATATVSRLRLCGWVLAGGYLVLLTGLSLARNPDFASEIALWQAEVEENPQDYVGWHCLAVGFANAGRIDAAAAAYGKMAELAPDYPGGLRSRAFFYMRGHQFREALPNAERVLALAVAQREPLAADFARLDLAEIQVGLGNAGLAAEYLAGIDGPLRDHPRYLEILGKVLSGEGRDEEAVAVLAEVGGDGPGQFVRHTHALSLLRLGRPREAREQLERAIREGNEAHESWNLLGITCVQLGDLPAAVQAFSRALELNPGDEVYRENLARARQEGRDGVASP